MGRGGGGGVGAEAFSSFFGFVMFLRYLPVSVWTFFYYMWVMCYYKH